MDLLEKLKSYKPSTNQEGLAENQIRLYRDVDDFTREYVIVTLEAEK